MKRLVIVLIIIALAFGIKLYLNKSSTGTAIEEIERHQGTPIGELLEEREVSDGEVVFYLRQNGDRAPVVSADYVNKSFLGWKWSVGGGHSLPAAASGTDTAWSFQYMEATKGTFLNHSPFPLIFGTVNNPAITAVTIKSVTTGQEVKAEVVLSQDKLLLWYAFIAEDQGKSFELTGLSSSGEIVSEKHIF